MDKIEFFEKEAEEIYKEPTIELQSLVLAKYKWNDTLNFFNESGENIIHIETITYGILSKKPDGKYEDLIQDFNFDISEEDIIETRPFKTNIQLSKSQILTIFKQLEEKFGLYAEEKICGGNYGEGAYYPLKYKISLGRVMALQKREERIKIEEQAIESYRHSGILDKLFWRKTK